MSYHANVCRILIKKARKWEEESHVLFHLGNPVFKMPAAYSSDLRWRIIELFYVANKTPRSIARQLRISTSTVSRILKRFEENGDVRPAKIGRPDISTLLSKAQLLVLMEYVLSHPTSYLAEMEQYLLSATGSSSSLVGINRVLKRFGYSRKRVSTFDHGFRRHFDEQANKLEITVFVCKFTV